MRNYVMKPERVCEISLRFRPPNIIIIHLRSFKIIRRFPFLLSFIFLTTKANHFFPPQEACGNKYIQDWIKNYVQGKRKLPMIWVCFLKKKGRGVKVNSKLGGQWKVKEKHLFAFSHLPPNKFYLNLQFFSFDLKVLLYHGFRPLLTYFLPFPWSINYDRASPCNKSSTPSLSIWFWLKLWFLSSLEIMASPMVTFYGPQAAHANE